MSFILNLCAPSWFKIKSNPTAVDGAKNFFCVLNLLSQQPKEDQIICKPVLKHTAYFAHYESILLAGVSDPHPKIRTDAIGRILQTKRTGLLQRDFILPDKINWDATEYPDMIEWLPESISVPPILQFWSEEQIKEGFERPYSIITIDSTNRYDIF